MRENKGQAGNHIGVVICATIRLRDGARFSPKPEMIPYDGERMRFVCIGNAGTPLYRGELAYMPDNPSSLPISWIAEGDLTEIVYEMGPRADTVS